MLQSELCVFWRQSHVKSRRAREDHELFCFGFSFLFSFACVVGKILKTPKLSPMADDAITRGGIGSLISLVYICGLGAESCSQIGLPYLKRECFVEINSGTYVSLIQMDLVYQLLMILSQKMCSMK